MPESPAVQRPRHALPTLFAHAGDGRRLLVAGYLLILVDAAAQILERTVVKDCGQYGVYALTVARNCVHEAHHNLLDAMGTLTPGMKTEGIRTVSDDEVVHFRPVELGAVLGRPSPGPLDRGSMRFIDRSHRVGPIAGANETPDPRWGFIVTYFSDDTRYNANSDSGPVLAKVEAAGLSRGDRFGGLSYPRVCDAMPR